MKDTPDTVIINVGSNDINNVDCNTISDNIMKIVNTCHENGASKIFVSSVIYRKGQEEKINTLNNILRFNQSSYSYLYIDNSNITQGDIWRDNIHLNNEGVAKITGNFIYALNSS